MKTVRATTPKGSAPRAQTRVARKRHTRKPRRRAGDWYEEIPSREHIPFEKRTIDSIEISSTLSKLPMLGREEAEDVVRMVPGEINPILRAANIEFVLVGAHGLATWLAQPRATQDVDYIIRECDARRAAEAIQRQLPVLVLEKHPDVWRFQRDGQYVLDLILTRTLLHKRVYKEFVEAGKGKSRYRVPKIEAALAMKCRVYGSPQGIAEEDAGCS